MAPAARAVQRAVQVPNNLTRNNLKHCLAKI
jgi:hypothetical protein